MSGHSKWATIKHKKASTDAKKSKAFSMVSKQIMVAVKEGGSGSAEQNPRLRLALEKAREVNMPKANVAKAIDRGLGKGGGAMIEEILYEGFGPGGVGMMVQVLTDNKNRTGSEIKVLFDRAGGSLAGPGAVSYMFERDGAEFKIKIPMPVEDDTRIQVEKLIEQFEEHDDVELVVANL